MRGRRGWQAAAAALCLLVSVAARSAPLLDSIQLVADAAVAGNVMPPAQTFSITEAGTYTVTLTDLRSPAALSSLELAIVTSAQSILTLSSAGSRSITLGPGTYTAQILATAATGALGGAFSVVVTPSAGGQPVWQYDDAVGPVNPAPSTGQAVFKDEFSITDAGTYQLNVTDQAFPSALSSLSIVVVNDCGTVVGCVVAPVSPTPLTGTSLSTPLVLAAGRYDVFVVASADTNSAVPAGLYSVQLSSPSGTLVYGTAVPVGVLPSAIPLTLTGAPATLQLTDLATPAALASIQAIVLESGAVLQRAPAAGSYALPGQAGTAQLFVQASPGGTQGAFEAYVTAQGLTLLDVAQPVVSTGGDAYAFPVSLASAGAYQIGVYDFQIPAAFGSLTAVAAQQGSVLATATGTASLDAAAGPLSVLVFPTLVNPVSGGGLFSVQLMSTASGATLLQTTQGVGRQFQSVSVPIKADGNYQVALADLAFPAAFSDLNVIITRGDSVVGQIAGSGTAGFAATEGTYVLNVLASVGSAVDYGLYGLGVAPAGVAPTVRLTASASSVPAGGSVTLSWDSTAASGCTASGGWSGSLSASGQQVAGPINATTLYSITCTGSAGSASAVVTVSVEPQASGGGRGGGGSMSVEELLVLLGVLSLRLSARWGRPSADTRVSG